MDVIEIENKVYLLLGKAVYIMAYKSIIVILHRFNGMHTFQGDDFFLDQIYFVLAVVR